MSAAGHDADAEEVPAAADAVRVPLLPRRRSLHHRRLRVRPLCALWRESVYLFERLGVSFNKWTVCVRI